MENKFKIYNTLTKQVETIKPNEDGKIAMYTCGPTVYHFAHIGNLRSYIMEDVLEKSLRFVGYDVKRVNPTRPQDEMDQIHFPDPVKEDIAILQKENAELTNRVIELENIVKNLRK